MPGVDVKTKGPMFAQPNDQVRRMGQRVVRRMVDLGEQRLALMMRPRPAGVYLSVAQAGKRASTGNYRRNLHTMVRELHGRIDDGGVIYGPWLENGREGTRFRGYAMFRRTQQWMEKQKRRVIEAEVSRLVQRLNG